MDNFKSYLKKQEEDVDKAIKRLPKKHQQLLQGYTVYFQDGNTLKGDNEHIGVVDTEKKTINLAAPLRFSREFVLYHETAHLVWAAYIKGTPLEQEWNSLVKKYKTKGITKRKENTEEVFAHTYANSFCTYKNLLFNVKPLENFIKKLSN